jgi:hypothetical protein
MTLLVYLNGALVLAAIHPASVGCILLFMRWIVRFPEAEAASQDFPLYVGWLIMDELP